ncbi:DUF4326 domain-containing protein [Streptomyces sp. H39-S7]|uniref:DUF4326 domain-containing protein n=1 Tax=Streptomyces sp. H39-S7 TaxID=3004357 RepID=UPI0022AFD105|nr:DUF4326 domain-containing protein [Streptomyces sp. H39-S7]MCZ4118092.1 DUF4326 domain-containing protein [Streptomyces sp. H39-S7]
MPVRLRGASRDAATLSTACAYVGPHSRYANPFTVGTRSPLGPPLDAAESVDLFAATLRGPVGRCYAARFARTLHGLDLMCTCPLDVPCHADVLLRLANEACGGSAIRAPFLLEGPR